MRIATFYEPDELPGCSTPRIHYIGPHTLRQTSHRSSPILCEPAVNEALHNEAGIGQEFYVRARAESAREPGTSPVYQCTAGPQVFSCFPLVSPILFVPGRSDGERPDPG